MLVTTTALVEGHRITAYHGLVTGEAVLGANIFRDMFAAVRDIVGGRAGGYERELKRARKIAVADLIEEAQDLGANAVVGIDLDYETLGKENGMLMVTATGTAVTIA